MKKNKFYFNYEAFKEELFQTKKIKHKQVSRALYKLRKAKFFNFEELGVSEDSRQITAVSAGFGAIKVLIWTQMHGNEATGTAAVFDIFNFIKNEKLLLKEKEEILKKCTLYFLPMVNPDGAESNKRRNSKDIDINRDARKLQTKEGRILMDFVDKIKPDFAFNLHDQEKYYSAGNFENTATISFLAPAFNIEKDIDSHREKSMQLIVKMNKILQNYIPDKVAKYSDTFMPNAFGDMVQKIGISTILIESGWYIGDYEKQFVRKLNFVAIMSAIESIVDKSFDSEDIKLYNNIPFNVKNKFFDFIIRNCNVSDSDETCIIDIGIRDNDFEGKSELVISDIGDLTDYSGFQEYDIKGDKLNKNVSIGKNANFLINKFFKATE